MSELGPSVDHRVLLVSAGVNPGPSRLESSPGWRVSAEQASHHQGVCSEQLMTFMCGYGMEHESTSTIYPLSPSLR